MADDPSYTPQEFCVLEKMSKSKLYQAWRLGIGPEYYWNGNRRRISEPNRRKWRKAREAAARKAREAEVRKAEASKIAAVSAT